MKKLIRFLFYLPITFFHLRHLRNTCIYVDLDFTLFDNNQLLKTSKNFYSLTISLNENISSRITEFQQKKVYIFTARGVFNRHMTKKQLEINSFSHYNRILFFGDTELKKLYLKINRVLFKKKILVIDDFGDYNFATGVLECTPPTTCQYNQIINPDEVHKPT